MWIFFYHQHQHAYMQCICCMWTVIRCIELIRAALRECESEAHIHASKSWRWIYRIWIVCVLDLRFLCALHSFVSFFRSVWCSNTYCYDLNRLFCTATKCSLIVFIHELVFFPASVFAAAAAVAPWHCMFYMKNLIWLPRTTRDTQPLNGIIACVRIKLTEKKLVKQSA